ncbi:hypothetical protein O181_017911 [Austropuccinia psidii MF-1]|uniref:Uncharacterized protein n=1 Tax=Austropuccinia psidii MF-1 TaxID=1389203 RepID=A0A9Q3GSF1_9BASI|nr:hypothetical protein [Austropuccinia psidii MF-1]
MYQAIKSRFSKTSWSSVSHHASKLFYLTNQSHSLTKNEISLGEAIEAIERQIGPLGRNKLIILSLLFLLPQMQYFITAALNTRLATKPSLIVNMEDILDIAQQISMKYSSDKYFQSMQLSKIDASRSNQSEGKQFMGSFFPKQP